MSSRVVSVNLVANIGQYVSGMNTAAGATLRLGESATKSTAKAKSGFDLASKGALVMGAAVVGGLGMAISKSMDFEKSMSAVGAATQATGTTLLGLREAAMKAGADTAYSATEAADAITEMGKAGVSAEDIMGGGLNGALALAAAGQIDVADAAGIASTAMAQFNLTGKDLPHVADLLAAGAGKAMGSVGDLGAALNQSGLIASAAGLSIEETTGTLAAFANAGLIGSDSGTSFKTMLQALQAPTEKSAGLMAELGINMYDANGNMLGVSEMAGQLQGTLGGLTEEQRNSALATIFGTDAVRAANVLYKEGAKGIQGWIDKTNEAGYASKQAAALQDNLAGDLEKLGGSFDTLMISMGQGSQGPLRDLVQGLTTLLDAIGGDAEAFASLPAPIRLALDAFSGLADVVGALASVFGSLSGPMQIATVAAVGWAVAGDRIMGAIRPMGSALSPMRDGWHAFGEALGYARANGDGLGTVLRSVGSYAGGQTLSAVKALGRAIGPELAVAAGAFVITSLIDGFQELAGASDEAKAAAEGLAGALTLTDEIADRHTIRKVIEDTDGLVGALERAGVSGQDAINGLLGYEGAQRRVTGALQEYINLRPGGIHNQEATDALNAKNAYIELATGYGTAAGNARFFADSAASATGATATTGGAAQAAAPQVDQFAAAAESAKAQVDDAKTAVDQFKLSLDILTGAHVSMLQVESAFEAAVADATGAMKDLNGSVLDGSGKLNMQSEAGRKAADVLLDVRDSGNQLISTMIQQGASADEVRAKDAQLRASFIKSAEQMGISRARAEDLADQILGIPASRNTTITADTKAANDKIAATQRAIDGMHGRDLEIRLRAAGRFVVTPNGGLQEFYSGGYTGPGSKYQVAGLAHAGEVVWSQDDVAAHGGPDRVDAMRKTRGSLPGYANGGPVLPINLDFNDSHLLTGMKSVASAMQNVARAPSGGATAGAGALVNFGHWLQSMGARVSEHPAFGGVTMGAHVPGSKHYSGRAIDVNTRAGTSALEQRELDPLMAAARAAGFQVIWRAAGHFNHGHVASYKTGTPFVPNDGLAYLHRGERVVPREQNLRSREFSGGGFGGGGTSVVKTDARQYVFNATTAKPTTQTEFVDMMRTQEFLHG